MKTTVARIENRKTDRFPCSMVIYTCKHTVAADYPCPIDIGSEAECKHCDWQVQDIAKIRAAKADGTLSHSRVRGGIYGSDIHVYIYDRTSPTGVKHLCSVEPSPEVDALLSSGYSPLSPTEKR